MLLPQASLMKTENSSRHIQNKTNSRSAFAGRERFFISSFSASVRAARHTSPQRVLSKTLCPRCFQPSASASRRHTAVPPVRPASYFALAEL